MREIKTKLHSELEEKSPQMTTRQNEIISNKLRVQAIKKEK